MVISLESQNVKVKRFTSFEFKIPRYKKNSLKVSINNRVIPYIIGIFFFSTIFASGWGLFIPIYSAELDLNSIILPDHSADVISKDEIAGYDFTVLENYYIEIKYHKSDSLSSLAIEYGVSRDSILHINGIADISKLDNLVAIKIPVSNGFIHRISGRDTLEKLSRIYSIPVKDIFRVNGLMSENISEIDNLFIPGVDPVEWGWNSNIGKYFVYPLNGYISKRYGFHTNSITGLTSLYEGLDISPIEDFRVYASRAGYISRIGYSANYGNYIFIDHHGGIRTLYAHLGRIDVSVRDKVDQGDVIATVGNSGFSSGIKLFFGMFSRDESIDPEEYLK